MNRRPTARLLPALVLLVACNPVDRQRFKVRGNGFVLEVVSTSDPDQVHARHFAIDVDPPARPTVRCEGRATPDEVHEQQWEAAALTEATLYGLLADTAYDCTITVSADGRELSGELGFETGELDGLPGFSVTTNSTAWGHYTLFNSWLTGEGGTDQVLMVVDDRGRVRWTERLPDDTAVGVEFAVAGPRSFWLGGGTLPPQTRTLAGATPFRFPDLDLTQSWYHHEAAPTPHGTVLGLRAVDNHDGNRTWEGFVVEERDRDSGALVWSWDSQSAYDAGVLQRFQGEDDPWHANALQWVDHPDGAFVSLSLPRRDAVLGLDPATNAVRFTLGRSGDLALTEGTWFSGQHDPEWTEDGRVLLHDNGVIGQSSRVLELAVDLDAGTATPVWEWTEPGWYERLWGDADRLGDGSVLVTRGHCAFCPDSAGGNSRIQVVDPQTGTISWALELADEERGLYRSERVPREALFAR